MIIATSASEYATWKQSAGAIKAYDASGPISQSQGRNVLGSYENIVCLRLKLGINVTANNAENRE